MAKILITNDDGIDSPGLEAAARAVLHLGTIIVVAPTKQQTGTGRGIFGDKEMRLQPVDYHIDDVALEAYHCNCSPALIVRHSLRTFLRDSLPNLVVSGINYGENLGFNITSSGTVGAALEGASFGVPGIAISKQTDIGSHHRYTEQDWSTTMHFLQKFAVPLLAATLPVDVDVLKIDVPHEATTATEWKITTLARNCYYFRDIKEPSVHSKIGDGETIIRVDEQTVDKDSDIYAIAKEKIVSVTPISLDLTSRVPFHHLSRLFG